MVAIYPEGAPLGATVRLEAPSQRRVDADKKEGLARSSTVSCSGCAASSLVVTAGWSLSIDRKVSYNGSHRSGCNPSPEAPREKLHRKTTMASGNRHRTMDRVVPSGWVRNRW